MGVMAGDEDVSIGIDGRPYLGFNEKLDQRS